MDNESTMLAANRLSYTSGCRYFNHNLWSSLSKGVGSKLKGKTLDVF